MSKLREALDRFDALFKRAADAGLNEPAAVTVATADPDGRPSARVVLLRGYDESGFVFYTNTLSRKGAGIDRGTARGNVLLLGPADGAGEGRGRRRRGDRCASRRLLEQPASAKPDRRLGLGAVRTAGKPRSARSQGRHVRRTIRRRPGASAPALVGLPRDPEPRRILALVARSPARAYLLLPRRRRVAGDAPSIPERALRLRAPLRSAAFATHVPRPSAPNPCPPPPPRPRRPFRCALCLPCSRRSQPAISFRTGTAR